MATARAVRAIVRVDALRLFRDRFLLGASAYIVACAVALRWLAPWLQAELARNGFDVVPYLPLGVSYFILVNSSVLTGMVGGFLLLETREERTLEALRVTPTPLTVQLGTLSAMVLVTGVLVAVVESALVGVGVPGWGAVWASAVVGAPTGVVMALVFATVASNKVEGFAVMKLTSFLGVVPLAAWFVPEPYQLVAGIAPPYWACKMWWVAASGGSGWAAYALPGLVVSGVWIAALLRRFQASLDR